MVRTVRVLGILSSSKEGQSSTESAELSKSQVSPKKCRLFIRLPVSESGVVSNASDANQISKMAVKKVQQNEVISPSGSNTSASNNLITTSSVLNNTEKSVGNVTKKSEIRVFPQRRRHAIVSVQNGGKGIIMSRLRQPSSAPTSIIDVKKQSNEREQTDDNPGASSQCYPPSEHTAHLLKLLSSGEILSYKELDEIVLYVNYLKSRRLVTDHLLKKKLISLFTEPKQPSEQKTCDNDNDSELLPIIPEKIACPLVAPKRRAAQSQDSTTPAKMPRLLEVLQSNDLPTGVTNMIRRRRSGLLRSREAQVSCEICGSRVQATHLKMHHKVCKGILIRRPRHGASSSASENMNQPRACHRCGKILPCDKDFEMHMAVAHKFYWRLEFDKEEEFKAWFREEGLDETMYIATCQTNSDFQQKVYYCAINRNQANQVKCPCRLVVKKAQDSIIVRYFVLHNHTERFVRRVMSVECRELIIKLLKEGLANYEILKKVKESYPKTSMNHYITRESITRLRYRYHRNSKAPAQKMTSSPSSAKSKKASVVQETDTPVSSKNQDTWPLPELRSSEMNSRNAGIDDVNNCSVIEPTNF